MKKRKIFWTYLVFFLTFTATLYAQDRRNPFSAEWDDSIQRLKGGSSHTLKVRFHVPSGHFLYREKTDVTLTHLAGIVELKKIFPPPEKKFDIFFKKEMEVYLHDFEISIPLKVPSHLPLGRKTLEGEIRYQGCSEDFCYRPMRLTLLVPLEIVSAESQGVISQTQRSTPSVSIPPPSNPTPSFWSLLKEGRLEQIKALSPFLLLILAFLGGVLTDFTPCVLPIIPLTLAAAGIHRDRSFVHNLGLSLSLVVGMSITYAVLGLISALLGLQLGFLFQSRYFLGFLILFFVIMSLGLFGVISFQLPLAVRNFFATLGGSGYRGAFVAGLTIGFVASPCVGPLVGPLLLWVAQLQNWVWGGVILWVYGLGMGSLFLVLGTFYGTLGARLRAGIYTHFIKKGLALLMLAPAIYYGSILFAQMKETTPPVGWVNSLTEGLQRAKLENRPVLIDFYADWCLPCLELDHKTFSESRVKRMIGDFVAIKIDCTFENSVCKEAVDRFGVVGWPTILFLDRGQKIQNDLSVVGGFVGPEKMLQILEEIKKRS